MGVQSYQKTTHKNVPNKIYRGSKLLIKGHAGRRVGLRLETKNVSFSVNSYMTMYFNPG